MRVDGIAKILTNVRTFQDCEIPGIVAQLIITNIPLMKGTIPKRLDIILLRFWHSINIHYVYLL